ncbi:unnamed protein product [Ilex paraguariensis]|uniref:SOSEKI DIX-like domain-containing protein n=1 Tax=Ilex paraguariensis TaxID=185542 RepID=A0ABC8RJ72_9AQUA
MEGHGGGGGGGGQVRRLHIIYLLSRNGRIEHPHLVRVHHLSRNGVRLKDVKRWLSELRGKDMPESFAWSYKRRYKTGYVWQDLLDEDLITPISDNEYVLKGSEILSTTSNNADHSYDGKKTSMQKEPPLEDHEAKPHKLSSKDINGEHPEAKMGVTTKTTCEIEEDSPSYNSETSALTDDSIKLEDDNRLDTAKREITDEQSHTFEDDSSSFYSTLLNDKNKKGNGDKPGNIGTPASSKSSSFRIRRSYSGGASHMFRSLITCRAVDTDESAMVMINRSNKASLNIPANKGYSKIIKGEKLGGSERIFGTPWNQQQHSRRKSCDGVEDKRKNKKSEFSKDKTVSAAYKPINGPTCSQCGKQFGPEKLYTHMKSCRGMKVFAKGSSPVFSSATAEKAPRKSMDSSYQDSVSRYYLTNH